MFWEFYDRSLLTIGTAAAVVGILLDRKRRKPTGQDQ